MRKFMPIALIAILGCVHSIYAKETQMQKEIIESVKAYLLGITGGKSEKMKPVFVKDAIIFGAKAGQKVSGGQIQILTWFHLGYNGVLELPNMREIVPQRIIKAHLILFIIGFGCALLWQMPLFAGLFCIICMLLSLIAGFALCRAYRIYTHTLKTAPRMKF